LCDKYGFLPFGKKPYLFLQKFVKKERRIVGRKADCNWACLCPGNDTALCYKLTGSLACALRAFVPPFKARLVLISGYKGPK